MTDLRKTIMRRTVGTFNHQGRRIVVALEPGDVLALREERTKKWFRAPIANVMRQVMVWNVDAERALAKRLLAERRKQKGARS